MAGRASRRALLPLGPPVRAARAVRQARPTAGRSPRATTTRWRRRIGRSARLIDALGRHRSVHLDRASPPITAKRSASTARSPQPVRLRHDAARAAGRRRSGDRAGSREAPVSLVDVAPTLASAARRRAVRLRTASILSPRSAAHEPPARELYAEIVRAAARLRLEPAARDAQRAASSSSPRRSRSCSGSAAEPDETRNLAGRIATQAATHRASGWTAISPATLPTRRRGIRRRGAAAGARLYVRGRPTAAADADPKDRRELAARIAQVTSGELDGRGARRALEQILADDPGNPQAHLRLGYVLWRRGSARAAERHFKAAIAGQLPGADALPRARRVPGVSRRVRGGEPRRCDRPEAPNPAIRSSSPTLASCSPTADVRGRRFRCSSGR